MDLDFASPDVVKPDFAAPDVVEPDLAAHDFAAPEDIPHVKWLHPRRPDWLDNE